MECYLPLSFEAYKQTNNHYALVFISLFLYVQRVGKIIFSPVELGGPGGGLQRPHEPFLVSEGMAEVAAVTVRADDSGQDHPTHLRLVAGVADDRAELLYAVGELAVVSIRAAARFLPFVTELRLEHPLVVHLQFQWLFLFFHSLHVHLLLFFQNRTTHH